MAKNPHKNIFKADLAKPDTANTTGSWPAEESGILIKKLQGMSTGIKPPRGYDMRQDQTKTTVR